jgi:hypothetical protein
MEDSSILTVARSCVELFERSGQVDEVAAEKTACDVEQFLDNQAGRFRILASNLGIFASGHASLDYRLRDSPYVTNLMISQLLGLQRHLHNGKYIHVEL